MSNAPQYSTTSTAPVRLHAGRHGIETVRAGMVASGEGLLPAGAIVGRLSADGSLVGVRRSEAGADALATDTSITLDGSAFFKAGETIAIGSSVASIAIDSVSTDGAGNTVLSFATQLGSAVGTGEAVLLETPDGSEKPVGVLLEDVDSTNAAVAATWQQHGEFRRSALTGLSAGVEALASQLIIVG